MSEASAAWARSTPRVASPRDASLDAVKGVLVLVMVAYHVMSIASSGGDERFQFIRFVSGAFIFVTGFVATRYALARFEADPRAVARAHVVRGIKVVLLFAALNLAIAFSGFGNPHKGHLDPTHFVESAATIFLAGDGKRTSFAILLPIGYLLVVAPAVMAAFTRGPTWSPFALLAAALAVTSRTALADHWPNIDFVMIGLAGMALGTPALSARWFDVGALRGAPWVTVFALVVALTGLYGTEGVLYVLGVAAIVKLVRDAVRTTSPGPLVLLGRYSLFAYVVQIVCIHVLFRLFGGQRWHVGTEVLALGLVSAAATWATCVVVDRLRRRSPLVDRAYRHLFA